MKTYPVMLPCHGGENVEIASIAEEVEGNYQDACRIALNADTWHFISPI